MKNPRTLIVILNKKYDYEYKITYDYKTRELFECHKLKKLEMGSANLLVSGKENVKKFLKLFIAYLGRFKNEDYTVKVYPYIKV